MCVLCDDPKEINFREIPLWALIRLNKMVQEDTIPTEPIVNKQWFKITPNEYICIVTFKYFDGYNWSYDILEFKAMR